MLRVFGRVGRAEEEVFSGVRWMSGLEGSGKELCREQGEGVVYGENLGFCVEVPRGGSLHTAFRVL